MEDMLGGFWGYLKSGMNAVVSFVEGIPLVGPFMRWLAYGYAAYSLGHGPFGWW